MALSSNSITGDSSGRSDRRSDRISRGDPESVLDELDSGISKRARFWSVMVQRVGSPMVFLGVILFFGYTVYQDIGKPIAKTHIETLNTMAESSKSTAESFKALAVAHQDSAAEAKQQRQLLEKIGDTQIEIKQVLRDSLQIQRSTMGQPIGGKGTGTPGGGSGGGE